MSAGGTCSMPGSNNVACPIPNGSANNTSQPDTSQTSRKA